ncbi:hypothetical protein [Actinoplanes sp. NPDC049118]|uniref:hypothetical protein n=1 Tax=Actinoplanes sp. NPDC049118 TaxID=3155769 RepID=UPI0033F36DB4
MHRPSFHRLVAAGALALAVLATAAAPASASRGTAGGARTGAATVVPDTSVLSVRGAGPYRIGARQQALAAAGLLSWVAPQPGCDVVVAGATGDWAGVILLSFRSGRLAEVGTATAPPRSPAGASVGMSWDDLEDIYGGRGRMIHNADGDPAYVVRAGSRVELYTGHPIRAGAGYFQAGPADFVLRNFLRGTVC